jgi:hypothetical protein
MKAKLFYPFLKGFFSSLTSLPQTLKSLRDKRVTQNFVVSMDENASGNLVGIKHVHIREFIKQLI